MDRRSHRLKGLTALAFAAALAGCDTLVRPDEADNGTGNLADDPEILVDIAEAAYDKRDWRTAEAAYTELTEKVPKEMEPWFRLGNIYARTNRPEAAVAAYKEALVRDAGLAKAWHNMAIVHLRQAANAFLQLRSHVEPESAEDIQADAMYQAIMDLMQAGPEAP